MVFSLRFLQYRTNRENVRRGEKERERRERERERERLSNCSIRDMGQVTTISMKVADMKVLGIRQEMNYSMACR